MVDLNELSKTEEGRKKIIDEASRLISYSDYTEHKSYWKLYNNEFNEEDFEYLYKYGENRLPAIIRHYPKQRVYMDYLESRHMKRPIMMSVKSVDKRSLKRKHDLYIKAIYDAIETNYKVRIYDYQKQIQQIESQIGQINQALNTQPKTQEEESQQQQLLQSSEEIMTQLDMAKMMLSQELIFTQKDAEEINKKRKAGLLDKIDIYAQKILKSLMRELRIKQISNQNLKHEIVTGKQYYYVNYRIGDPKPIFKSIPAHSVFYDNSSDTQWVHKCDLAGFVEYMSYSSILAEFGDKLSYADKESLKRYADFGYTNSTFHPTENGGAVYNPHSGTDITNEGIRVIRTWWKKEKEVRVILTPNKYNPKLKHYTIVPNGNEVLNEDEFTYIKKERKWINNKNEKVTFEYDKVNTYSKDKKQIYTKRYYTERYYGLLIGDSIYLSGKDDIQLHSTDSFTDTTLPIIGLKYNNFDIQPYSLIKATKGLQEMFNIVSYHRELMLAVSGTKAILLDELQKPEGMTEQEWYYQIKLGFAKIQTKKKGVQSSFNQFTVLDMSLSPAIQYLDSILENIDAQMGMMLGVTRQALGHTVPSDQVGTYQMAQQSTLLVTEAIYYRHEMILSQALEVLINLVTKYMSSTEHIFEDEENIIQFIPIDILSDSDYQVGVYNSFNDDAKMLELKQALTQFVGNGILTPDQFIKLYNIESIKELELATEDYIEKNMQIRQQMSQSEYTSKAEAEMQLLQLKQQFEEKIKQAELQLKAAELQVKNKTADASIQLQQANLELQKEQMIIDSQLRSEELSNESAVELSYLSEQAESRRIDQQIKMLELKIEAIMNNLNMKLQANNSDKSHKQTMKKLQIEDFKARSGKGKEKIKD